MPHYAFRERRLPIDLEAEYVVIGSGAGGSQIAVDLARGGAKVAMVEAGAWRDPEDYPSSFYGTARDMMPDWGASLTNGRAFWPVVQGRCVGGSMTINSAIVVRTPGDVFRDWARDHGLPEKDFSETIWKHEDELEKELKVGPTSDEALGVHTKKAIEASEKLGYTSHRTARNAPGCVGDGQCLQGCRSNKKLTPNVIYAPEILRNGGTVVSCAPVRRILVEHGRAVGVAGHFVHPLDHRRGGAFTVRATKAVVLAASATWSPVLLIKSKIGNRNVGRFFRAHPGNSALGVYPDLVDMNKGVTQGWASTHFRESIGTKLETLSIPPDMLVARLPGAGPAFAERLKSYRHLAMWVQGVRAVDTVGEVREGWFGNPVVRYTMARSDMERARKGLHVLVKSHFAAGAREVITGVYGMPTTIGPDQADLVLNCSLEPRDHLMILSHLFGGCVMGADPARSVCDERGWVRGVLGLMVSDASAFPSTLGVNPQHTIMAISRMRAHQLLDQ